MVESHEWVAMADRESLRNLLVKAGFQVAVRWHLAQVPELLGGLPQRCFKFGRPLLAPQACRLSSKLRHNLFDGIVRFHVSHVYSIAPYSREVIGILDNHYAPVKQRPSNVRHARLAVIFAPVDSRPLAGRPGDSYA